MNIYRLEIIQTEKAISVQKLEHLWIFILEEKRSKNGRKLKKWIKIPKKSLINIKQNKK